MSADFVEKFASGTERSLVSVAACDVPRVVQLQRGPCNLGQGHPVVTAAQTGQDTEICIDDDDDKDKSVTATDLPLIVADRTRIIHPRTRGSMLRQQTRTDV